jgi:hypothetical protein
MNVKCQLQMLVLISETLFISFDTQDNGNGITVLLKLQLGAKLTLSRLTKKF